MLLFTEPLSSVFFTFYIVCGATDILDGYAARKTNGASRAGAILDSTADFIFVAVMLFIMIPIIEVEFWVKLWLIGISTVKASSLLMGFIKYRSLAFLHTYMNKATGALLFAFPLFYHGLGITVTSFLLCGAASIAAVEELFINIKSEQLVYDIKSILLK